MPLIQQGIDQGLITFSDDKKTSFIFIKTIKDAIK